MCGWVEGFLQTNPRLQSERGPRLGRIKRALEYSRQEVGGEDLVMLPFLRHCLPSAFRNTPHSLQWGHLDPTGHFLDLGRQCKFGEGRGCLGTCSRGRDFQSHQGLHT